MLISGAWMVSRSTGPGKVLPTTGLSAMRQTVMVILILVWTVSLVHVEYCTNVQSKSDLVSTCLLLSPSLGMRGAVLAENPLELWLCSQSKPGKSWFAVWCSNYTYHLLLPEQLPGDFCQTEKCWLCVKEKEKAEFGVLWEQPELLGVMWTWASQTTHTSLSGYPVFFHYAGMSDC